MRGREGGRGKERARERENKLKPSQSIVSSALYGNIVFVSVNSGQLPGRKLREQPSRRQSFTTTSRVVRRGQSSGGASGSHFGWRIASTHANADAVLTVARTAVSRLSKHGFCSVRSGIVRLGDHSDVERRRESIEGAWRLRLSGRLSTLRRDPAPGKKLAQAPIVLVQVSVQQLGYNGDDDAEFRLDVDRDQDRS